MRRAGLPAGMPARALNLEEEDEKENDRHRRRQQQSQNDPGAKACEATCVFCVGMLFLQVAWIVYTYGVQGTMNLLMAPEEALRGGPRTCSTYVTSAAPSGYDAEVVVLHDAEAGVQRIHYTANGARPAACAGVGVRGEWAQRLCDARRRRVRGGAACVLANAAPCDARAAACAPR
jgi:hypothetical protein